MTPAMLLTLIIAMVVVTVSVVGLLVTVLINVKSDSRATGKLGEQVAEFTTRVTKFETDRLDIIARNDQRIAEAVSASNEIAALRDKDIIEAVRGFREVVDDLKSEFSAIKNMWAGERKLIEQLRSLELEIARLIEKFRALEHDLMRLQLDHEKNHPREQSGPIPTQRQEGAPRALCGADEGDDK